MTARKAKRAERAERWLTIGLVLAISLLVLGRATGEIGHALAGDAGHAFETTTILATLTGAPTTPTTPPTPDPTSPMSSHVETDCPLCRVGCASSSALSEAPTGFSAIGETAQSVFLPETPAPSLQHRRADAARAPPATIPS